MFYLSRPPRHFAGPEGWNLVDGFHSICSNALVEPIGRILAVDYGQKNIGLAYSDELGLTVQPLPSIPNCGKRDFLNRLRLTVQTLGVQAIAVGIPLNMDGTRGEAVSRIKPIIQFLKSELRLPLIEVDERLSTIEAMELWREMSPRQQKRYRTIDSLAAAFILERHLKEN